MRGASFLFSLALAFSAASVVQSSASEPLAEPKGKVVLTATGNISVKNTAGGAEFDRSMLEALEWRTVHSVTRWTEGLQTFEGVPLKSVLRRVGANGETILATALNDYTVEIPSSDADDHEPLLAMKRNGEWMKVRDKGPIWIIYPARSLNDISDIHANRMVWQLRSLGFK